MLLRPARFRAVRPPTSHAADPGWGRVSSWPARRKSVSTTSRITATALAAAVGMTALAACGGPGDESADAKTVTLVSHDSFSASKSVLAAFEKESGYKVKVLPGGDAGKAVNQAILSKDNPQGD